MPGQRVALDQHALRNGGASVREGHRTGSAPRTWASAKATMRSAVPKRQSEGPSGCSDPHFMAFSGVTQLNRLGEGRVSCDCPTAYTGTGAVHSGHRAPPTLPSHHAALAPCNGLRVPRLLRQRVRLDSHAQHQLLALCQLPHVPERGGGDEGGSRGRGGPARSRDASLCCVALGRQSHAGEGPCSHGGAILCAGSRVQRVRAAGEVALVGTGDGAVRSERALTRDRRTGWMECTFLSRRWTGPVPPSRSQRAAGRVGALAQWKRAIAAASARAEPDVGHVISHAARDTAWGAQERGWMRHWPGGIPPFSSEGVTHLGWPFLVHCFGKLQAAPHRRCVAALGPRQVGGVDGEARRGQHGAQVARVRLVRAVGPRRVDGEGRGKGERGLAGRFTGRGRGPHPVGAIGSRWLCKIGALFLVGGVQAPEWASR